MPEPLTRTKTLLYSAGSIGAGAFFAFNNFVLPQLLKAAGAGDLLTGLLSSTRSIEGAIIQPTIGALSDRTRGRFGRRRPFIALGIPLSAVFFVVAATVFSLWPGVFTSAVGDPVGSGQMGRGLYEVTVLGTMAVIVVVAVVFWAMGRSRQTSAEFELATADGESVLKG